MKYGAAIQISMIIIQMNIMMLKNRIVEPPVDYIKLVEIFKVIYSFRCAKKKST
jgi:hypothetical protein